jgi:hypothetical protein
MAGTGLLLEAMRLREPRVAPVLAQLAQALRIWGSLLAGLP